MTILINIDDFLFQLFPETNKDIAQIKEKLIKFYTIDDVKPEIKVESDVYPSEQLHLPELLKVV